MNAEGIDKGAYLTAYHMEFRQHRRDFSKCKFKSLDGVFGYMDDILIYGRVKPSNRQKSKENNG